MSSEGPNRTTGEDEPPYRFVFKRAKRVPPYTRRLQRHLRWAKYLHLYYGRPVLLTSGREWTFGQFLFHECGAESETPVERPLRALDRLIDRLDGLWERIVSCNTVAGAALGEPTNWVTGGQDGRTSCLIGLNIHSVGRAVIDVNAEEVEQIAKVVESLDLDDSDRRLLDDCRWHAAPPSVAAVGWNHEMVPWLLPFRAESLIAHLDRIVLLELEAAATGWKPPTGIPRRPAKRPRRPPADLQPLTERQREALNLFLELESESAVARQMGIHVSTARQHIHAAAKKMGWALSTKKPRTHRLGVDRRGQDSIASDDEGPASSRPRGRVERDRRKGQR